MFRSTAPNTRSPIPVISVKIFIQAAAEGRHTQIYFYLLSNKDDPIAMNASWKNGETALIAAAKHGHVGIVKRLLSSPVININAADHDGNTPLIFAAVHGRKEVVKLLLGVRTININAINQDGFTALTKAAMQGHVEIVKILLAVPDINLTIHNIFGRNAPEEAIAHGQQECARLIYDAAIAASKALPQNPLICPLTLTYMTDPVTVSSGITYDRSALTQLFGTQPEAKTIDCAISGKKIHRDECQTATNYAILKLISEHHAREQDKEDFPIFESPDGDSWCTIS